MTISERLLEILVCPENKTSLRSADENTVERLNAAIAEGRIRNRAGAKVNEPVDSGLVREDGRYLYPVREDIPVMLVDEAIPMEQME